MRKVELVPRSRRDLDTIVDRIAERSGSIALAVRFGNELLDRCTALASHDFVMGRSRPDLRAGLRSVAHKEYVLLFEYPDDNTLRLCA